jgi:hypothetical protein
LHSVVCAIHRLCRVAILRKALFLGLCDVLALLIRDRRIGSVLNIIAVVICIRCGFILSIILMLASGCHLSSVVALVAFGVAPLIPTFSN